MNRNRNVYSPTAKPKSTPWWVELIGAIALVVIFVLFVVIFGDAAGAGW